ncbi:flavo protein [Aureobasidium pullulans]|uniref:Flavo protein n=1 Tax=Aureobasidium pullulans TaxID=5580 RepID=A0A4S9SF13_AURPU|nr:flavo protein [Aureobasidium pullulans]
MSKPSTALRASDHQDDGRPHVLLACTGSVATIKIPLIIQALSKHDISMRLILSSSASQFLQGQSAEQPSISSLLEIPNLEAVYTDEDEWSQPWTRGADILHIELRRWADIMIIAPLSANSMAKMVAGMADSLVMSVVRAWDTTAILDAQRPNLPSTLRTSTGKKPLLVAPAMNTAMWAHPVTHKQAAVLEQEWGVETGGWVRLIRPVEKELACGDTGGGAMREWKEVVSITRQYLDVEATDNVASTKTQ